ncbi:unnamed protein product [Rotaria sordida]|uniref:Uncharacterized protein n=1 Tax=Rotaria sordida TaxID=392033 RepID=A0A819AGZ7_9BILA|nr:unnamed protein product [Rotaria sordida]
MTESNISSFLYNINRYSKTNFDCLYAHIIDDLYQNDGTFIRTNYLTPFCQRPLLNESMNEDLTSKEGYVKNRINFSSLRSQGISSEQLLEWSISIDIIEEYAIYLIENDPKLSEIIFSNCSSLWFGSHCQYTFGSNIEIESFGDFLVSSFNNRQKYPSGLTINTCYPHLFGCFRGPKPMCLDWREICNGIIDCIGDNFGIDEKYCDELEMNECKEDEYRCHNGAQCIPLEFFRDGWTSKDCLDGTDEEETILKRPELNDVSTLNCIKMLTFPCEERSCRYQRSFPCGDGECLDFGLNNGHFKGVSCSGTRRDIDYAYSIYKTLNHLSDDCQKLIFHKFGLYRPSPNKKEDYTSENWLSLNNCSMDNISFPAYPIFNGYFQVIYSTKSLINDSFSNAPPDYVCNDPRQCLHLPKATIQIGGLDCRPFNQAVEEYYIMDLYDLHSVLDSLMDICSLMGNINKYTSNSSLFYCQSSQRYISKHRLIDSFVDCYHEEDEKYQNSCLLNDTQRFRCQSKQICISPIGITMFSGDCRDEYISLTKPKSSLLAFLCNFIPEVREENGDDDETNCEWWPCNNPYTRCDNIFHCANGIDEFDCPNSYCNINEFKCIIDDSIDYLCISQANIYEKIINCSKHNDDEIICRKLFYSANLINEKNKYLSWKETTCLTDNDICGQPSLNNQHLICNHDTVSMSLCNQLI